ncbi:MAG: xanthine dehydrogenase family protein molybdopterin-binding subunit [Thermoanaerobaculales bacterium]|nr:xanthine dehydrogenase family protein molybdopterin-binding subunit [Thermoanaerobaculales bacterium]
MTERTDYHIGGTPPETPGNDAAAGPWPATTVVGSRQPRIDAYERVSGTAVYPHDVSLPGMLHGAILRCPHAHARVLAVDTAAAEKMPGVAAVITAATPGADIPWYERDGGFASTLFDPHCRHQGEEVAAVAAETPLQAVDAIRAIRVTYEELPFVVDDTAALAPGAPAIHDGGNLIGEPRVRSRGDIAAGFAEAEVVVEGVYRTSCQIHAPMEPHGSVARWDGNRLTVWDSTQGVYDVQERLAAALELPRSSVRVIGPYMGGGFGSKLETGKYTVIATLLARMTARPVKIFLPREDCFTSTGNRPANTMTIKIGAKADGTLTAIEYASSGSGGAYFGDAGTGALPAYLYQVANLHAIDTTVHTNAGKARPMRAPGVPQAAWALEQAMDELAAKLGLDPLELRLRNIPATLQAGPGLPFTSQHLRECLVKGAEAFGWAEAVARPPDEGHLRRGVGLAAGMWFYSGGPPSTVVVKLHADGSANLNMGASDIGCGTKTWAAMIVAEELGVPLEQIQVEHADTATTQYATSSGGSKTVPSDSPAVLAAARSVKHQLIGFAAEQLGVPADDLVYADLALTSRSDPSKTLKVTEIGMLGRRGVVVGTGYREPNPEGSFTAPTCAQFCEVEVDTRTGGLRILRFLGAHDSGRVLNRLTFDNQVFGGMAMGIGLGVTEERVLDRQTGRMVNANLHDYKIPTMLDVAGDHACLPIDEPDHAFNTTGAKGLGEPATIPTAAAVGNAVARALGVRISDAPLTPRRILDALAAQRKEA